MVRTTHHDNEVLFRRHQVLIKTGGKKDSKGAANVSVCKQCSDTHVHL